MDEIQKEDFNMQIRKLLKQFGVKAHNLVQERFNKNENECKVSLKLEIDSNEVEKITSLIKIN